MSSVSYGSDAGNRAGNRAGNTGNDAVIEERREHKCCGRVYFTEVVRVDGNGQRLAAFLLLPDLKLIATEFHGGCLICGGEIHWSPPYVSIRKLLAGVRR